MANILLIANLNCDRILLLDKPLQAGGRFHYRDGGQRLGGGGANTGLGLVWAKHSVALVSQVGRDKVGDWLLAEASDQGIDCHLIQRHDGATNEMLLVVTPDGERTIIRPERPIFELAASPTWDKWDVVYFNSSAQGAVEWARRALPYCLVIAQLATDDRPRPCHILLASKADMLGRSDVTIWEYGVSIATASLKYFIVTDGANGTSLYTQDSCIEQDSIPVDVVDTTGAGDAYAAGLIHGMTSGMDIIDAMKEGAVWAAFAVATNSSIPGTGLQQYLQS